MQNGSLVGIGTEIIYDQIWATTGHFQDAHIAIARATAGIALRIVPIGYERERGRREISSKDFDLAFYIYDKRPNADKKVEDYVVKASSAH